MKPRILVADDEKKAVEFIAMSLSTGAYTILSATTGRDALRMIGQYHPDLIILDLVMPEVDGWQVTEQVRKVSDTPIILVTGRASAEGIAYGLRLGADECITKPFSPRELQDRVQALLSHARRTVTSAGALFDDGTLRVDLRSGRVFLHAESIELSDHELRLLSCLVRSEGAVVPRERLLREVWGTGYLDITVTPASLSDHIDHLQRKLGDDPRNPTYIHADPDLGYWFGQRRPTPPRPMHHGRINASLQ